MNFSRNLKQTAVYWGTPVSDGEGNFTFATAVEIAVRWEDSIQIILDKQGDEKVSRAKVYTDQDIDSEGYMYLGALTDLTEAEKTNPRLKEEAYEVVGFNKIPNRKGTDFLRRTWL